MAAARPRSGKRGGTSPESPGNAGAATTLAGLLHDLRSPLHAMDAFVELLLLELLGPVNERQRDALERVRLGARHILALVEQVFEEARLPQGGYAWAPQAVDLRAILEEALLLVRPEAESKRQELLCELPADVAVLAEPHRLRQIMMNLLTNAIRYTPVQGTVRIAASGEPDAERLVAVQVADNGPGIPADQLDAIFRPYYRLAGPDPATAQGVGLGLAIARQLVRQMGGEIEVQSELGRGSTFTVWLPAAGPGS
ncbi:MAG: HAMP domain-containing histidine kinase [Gemmatimonadetes bacterium]|nr:HAMP domain-containing histidine kinase [Gemmatimonadota bacterium]